MSIIDLIDDAFKRRIESEDSELRGHLGGSMIGRTCSRELWYSFRWARTGSFDGRMLRLFDRGHREEERFVDYLRLVGAQVWEYSQLLWYHSSSDSYVTTEIDAEPDDNGELDDVTHLKFHVWRAEHEFGIKLRQWRVIDVSGHFGGSLDGIAINIPDPEIPPDTEVLCEFKTHNEKSFRKLEIDKLKAAKPVHWLQMQIYMEKKQLDYGFYMAVNKNTDELYTEVIRREPNVGAELLAKANQIIHSKQPPDRAFRSPTWFDCKYCSFHKNCWMNEPMLRTCRSCVCSTPSEDGQWHCGYWNQIIPSEAVMKGCDNYKQITD